MPGYVADALDELTGVGLLALAGPDSGERRVTLTDAAQARYTQLRGNARRAGLRVPDPRFPTKIPDGERLSGPGPLVPSSGGTLDPHCPARESRDGPLRRARCPDDRRLHLLQPADVAAATGGHAEALCGHPMPTEGLTIINGSPGALCMACVVGVSPKTPSHDPRGTP